MDDLKSKAEYYYEHIKGYVNTNLELFKLTLIEKSTLAFSSLISAIILLLFCFVIIILISIGLSMKFSEVFNSASTGYFLVALIHLIFVIALFIFRKKLLIIPIMNYFIGSIQNSLKSEDEEN